MRSALSEEEIKRIVSSVVPRTTEARSTNEIDALVVYEVQSRALDRARETLAKRLRGVEIGSSRAVGGPSRSSKINELESRLRERYLRARIQPGESIGLTVALGLGELQSQGKLNKFHTSGGLVMSSSDRDETSRFADMISVTRAGNFTTTLFPLVSLKSISAARRYVAHRLVSLHLWQLMQRPTGVPPKGQRPTGVPPKGQRSGRTEGVKHGEREKAWWTLHTLLYDIEPNREGLIFVSLDRLQLEMKDISMQMVREKLAPFDPIYAPEAFCSFAYRQEHHGAISKLDFCGVPGVKSMSFSFDETLGSFIVKTEGGSLKHLMGVPLFDHSRTWSSDPRAILETFGVEATRFFLVDEMKSICGSIDHGHITLLVDFMLSNGSLRPIKRSTQKKSSAYGPLSRMSFEGIFGHLVEGALRGDVDECTGISSSVFLGKHGQCGTGSVGLGLDLDEIGK